MSWNRIAQEVMDATERDGQPRIYLTQEAVRRWVRADDARQVERAEQDAA